MRTVIVLSIFVLCALTSQSINAEALSLDGMENTDEQSALFGDIASVYSAARHEQPITKAPASVDIITSDQIKRYGWRTVASALGSLPGFLTTSDGTYSHVGVRGLNIPDDYNTHILVLIDGHRVNENLQDYAGLGDDFLVDMQNIDRIEVVRGPGSALYGSSAFFAVVNVMTQRGRDIQGTRLTADAGSYDTYGGQISNGQKFSNGVESFASGSFSNSSGRSAVSFPSVGTAQNLDGQQVGRLYGKVSWQDVTLSGGWMDRLKSDPAGTGGTPSPFQPGTVYHDRRGYVDLNYKHTFANSWDLTQRLFWDIYQFTGNYPYGTVVNQDQWMGQWFGMESLLSHDLFEHNRLTLGAEYRRNYQQMMDNMNLNPYALLANNQLSSNIYSFFAQDEWALFDSLHLHAGARYDHYDNFGGTFNPRTGIIYEPKSGTNIKLLYGTAFKAPSAYQFAYSCCLGGWTNNPKLEPEQIETYETVLEQRLGDNYDLRINPYYNRIYNLITLVSLPSNVLQFKDYDNAESHGIETQIKAHYDDIEARLSYTLQKTSISMAANTPNSPTHMVKLNLTAPLIAEKLYGGLEVQYVSQRFTTDGLSTNGYTITNINAFTRRWLPGVEITGGLYNLFNVYYTDPLGSSFIPDAIVQYGRNFRIRMSVTF